MSGEHLWPEWVQTLIPPSKKALHSMRQRTSPDEAEIKREFRGLTFSMKVNDVCAPCNNGWMSVLERRVKPIAAGMILGRGRQLHEGGQTTLAAWAVLKALMFQFTHPAGYQHAPKWQYDALYELKTSPPNGVLVYIAQYNGRHVGFYNSRSLRRNEPANADASDYAYSAAISVGHLVFQVVAPCGDHHLTSFTHPPPLAGSVKQIWPPSPSFIFPPGPALTSKGLEVLAGFDVS